MATVGEIAIVVGADVGPMVRELGKGKGALNDFGNAGSKIGGILGTAMGKAVVGVGAAATAVRKLTNNIYFAQVIDGVEVLAPVRVTALESAPKRRGRPPKAK